MHEITSAPSYVIAKKMCRYTILCLVFFCKIVSSRDFYAGMFSKDDFLVAQDRLYKEKVMYHTTYAKYGRYFKCPITYFRVQDRLGIGKGPRVEVTRGGLRQRFIVLRLTSVYSLPISVNIYVGCENKNKTKLTMAPRRTTVTKGGDGETSGVTEAGDTTAGGTDETSPGGGDNGDVTTEPAAPADR